MTEKEERLARERAEIAARVANFKETQQKFEREREEYYATTLGNAWSTVDVWSDRSEPEKNSKPRNETAVRSFSIQVQQPCER